MTLFSAHRSFELNKRFAPDQRSAIVSTRYCWRGLHQQIFLRYS